MARTCAFWLPFILLPTIAWSRDLAAVSLFFGACMALFLNELNWREIISTGQRAPLFRVALGFVLWSFAAVFWAPHLPFISWFKVFLTLAAITILTVSLIRLSHKTIHQLETPVIMMTFALFGLLLFERATDGLLIRLDRESDTSVQILDTLSGGLVLLSCICFPVAWILWRKTKKWVWPVAFVGACLALSASYRMDAVPVGLLVGISAFLIVLRWRARALAAIAISAGGIALIWGPLAIGASALHFDAWLTDNIDRNWGYRIVIWQYVGELLPDHFLIGHGFDASRIVGAAADLLPERDGASTFLHPHNGLLQIWLELGVIGVVLFVAAAGIIFRQILAAAPSPGAMAVAAGTFGFSTTIWLLSYGVWQGWWLAVLGLAASAVILAFRIDSDIASN